MLGNEAFSRVFTVMICREFAQASLTFLLHHPDSTAKLRKLSTESRKLWLAESVPWLDFEKFHFSWQSWLNTCLGDLG